MYFPGTHRKQGLPKHGTRSRKEPLGTMVEMSSDSLKLRGLCLDPFYTSASWLSLRRPAIWISLPNHSSWAGLSLSQATSRTWLIYILGLIPHSWEVKFWLTALSQVSTLGLTSYGQGGSGSLITKWLPGCIPECRWDSSQEGVKSHPDTMESVFHKVQRWEVNEGF